MFNIIVARFRLTISQKYHQKINLITSLKLLEIMSSANFNNTLQIFELLNDGMEFDLNLNILAKA